MEVQINPNESYKIFLPENLSAEEFRVFVFRMNEISKLVSKSAFVEETLDVGEKTLLKRTRKFKVRPELKDKNNLIEMLKTFYFGSEEDKLYWIKRLDYTNCKKWGASIRHARIILKIKPEEIGLIRFPLPGEFHNINNLRLNDDTSNIIE